MQFSYLGHRDLVQVPSKFNSPFFTQKEIAAQKYLKYASYTDVVKHSSDKVSKLVAAMLGCIFPTGHLFTVIDVKPKYVKAGQISCLPGFHTDCTLDPYHETLPESHCIFVTGALCPTRFINQPLTIEYEDKKEIFKSIQNAVLVQNPKIFELEQDRFYLYGRHALHAGGIAQEEGWRLLIRVTLTDLVRPQRVR